MTLEEYKNEIKELKERLEKLETTKVEKPQPKRWKPEYNETYWFLNGDVYCEKWTGCLWDSFQYIIGNCFKTEEEAKEYKKKIEYTAQYKNYIEEHSDPIDWNDRVTSKYFADFNWDSHEIEVSCYNRYKQQGTIYASREQIIWLAIQEIGEDNFKKYVLEVE